MCTGEHDKSSEHEYEAPLDYYYKCGITYGAPIRIRNEESVRNGKTYKIHGVTKPT